jgi:4-alpha-glucanotransferase
MKILQFGFGTESAHSPDQLRPNVVAYTGTHDNDTVRGWWHNASEHERAYAASYLHAGADDIHWAMIRACCDSVANIAIFPLQDVLGLDGSHRMNVPGTIGAHNWTWRFDWQWITASATGRLVRMIHDSGRGPSGPPTES